MTIRDGIVRIWRWLRIAAIAAVALTVAVVSVYLRLLQDRNSVEDLGWPAAEEIAEPGDAVTVTWLGVTTLLFDDSETQILIDGFFTRVGPLEMSFTKIETDIAAVNHAMAEFRINRLAAIIPVHSHFDHAMDVGIVSNRSTAVVLGSESTANIVRGSQLPVNQYQILADRETRQFGDFTIRLIASKHAPVADGKSHYFPGSIASPLQQPAHVGAWKTGVPWSIEISHPRGTTLVQGSAGFIRNNLNDIQADVVMLGLGGLQALGQDYARAYWHETVVATNASRVYPIHYDDFTLPFGEIALFPTVVEDMLPAARWIDEFAANEDTPASVNLLPFGRRIVLY